MNRIPLFLVAAVLAIACKPEQPAPAKVATPPQAQAAPLAAPPPAQVLGSLDAANCQLIGGWAWDTRQPSTPVQVELFEGDQKVGSLAAAESRPDLVKAGIGDGKHGFTLPLPPALRDGKSHTIRARVVGASVDLPNGPKTLVCAG